MEKFYSKFKNKLLLTFTLIALTTVSTVEHKIYAQTTKVNTYLRMVAEGKIDEVKRNLPELIKDYGEDPGVLLLQGVILEDASRAVPYYKKILEKFPNSEWSHHAAWRMIQYYSIVTDTATAKRAMDTFRIKYPNSPFLSAAAEAVRFSISDAKYRNRDNYLNPPKIDNDKAINEKAMNENIVIATKEKYGLQVGIYSTKVAAETEKERFSKTLNMRAEVLEKLVMGERRYAVVIGDYNSEEEALIAKKNYVERRCQCNPLVFKK